MTLAAQPSPGSPITTRAWALATVTEPPKVLPQMRIWPGVDAAVSEPVTVEFSMSMAAPLETVTEPEIVAWLRHVVDPGLVMTTPCAPVMVVPQPTV